MKKLEEKIRKRGKSMPYTDETGSFWTQDRYRRHWGSHGHNPYFRYRYWQKFAVAEKCNLTKEKKENTRRRIKRNRKEKRNYRK